MSIEMPRETTPGRPTQQSPRIADRPVEPPQIPFVGREFEIGCLLDALSASTAGDGGLLLVAGRAGVGKSRLVTEFCRTVASRDGLSLTIRIGEFPVGSLPVWWGRFADALTGRRRHGRLLSPQADAVIAGIGSRPIVIVVEDLHLAAPAAMSVVARVAHEAGARGVLTVGTYRFDHRDARPWLDVQSDLMRSSRFGAIIVDGWSAAETATAISHAQGGGENCPGLTELVHGLSGGNPGYIADLMHSIPAEVLTAGGAVATHHFRAAVLRRLRAMSRRCEEFVRFAALLEGDLTLNLLGAIFPEHDEHALAEIVDEAVAVGVLTETDRLGDYRFAHPLVRELIRGGMSAARRVHLHTMVAELLVTHAEAHGGIEPATIAYHFTQAAGLSPRAAQRALDYQLAAARKAEGDANWDAAAKHHSAASLLVRHVDGEVREGEILRNLARSQRNGGNRRAAWISAMRAIEWYQRCQDAEGVARSALLAATISAPSHRHVLLLNEALGGLPPGDASNATRADLLLQLAITDGIGNEERERLIAHGRAAAQHVQSEPLTARIEFADAVARARRSLEGGAYDDSLVHDLNAAHHSLSAHGYIEDAFDALGLAGQYSASWGHLQVARRQAEVLMGYRKRAGLSVGSKGHPEILMATLLWMRGEMSAFEQMLDRLHPGMLDYWIFPMQYAEYQGDFDRALALIPDTSIAGNVPTMLAFVLGSRARLWKNAGDHGRARAEVDAWLNVLPQFDPAEQGVRIAGLADVLSVVEDPQRLRRLYDIAVASDLQWDRSLGATAERGRGDLAFRLGHIETAEGHYQRSQEWCEREYLPVEGAWCDVGLAQIEDSRGNRASAAVHLSRAHERFRSHGAALGLIEVERIRGIWDPTPALPHGNTLTAREIEVLRLIARGRTNDEIARELVISRNTVANHVSHILGKVGAANRTAAAAIGHHLGLM